MRIIIFLLLILAQTCLPHWVNAVNAQQRQISQTASAPEQDLGSLNLQNIVEDIRDIHGPLPIPEYPVQILLLLVAAVLLLVLLGCLYIFWKHRRSAPAARVSAAQKAIAELDDTHAFMTTEQAFFYMERVSDILRRYIESRFSIPCTRKTSCEFMQMLHERGSAEINQLQLFSSELKNCLEMCDMAKFSGRRPMHQEMVQVDQAIRILIEKTDEQQKTSGER
jgi:cbb3-type cytochrome oxidase subunit 3